jgi:hypothetical protein
MRCGVGELHLQQPFRDHGVLYVMAYSAECECIRPHAGIQELDFESSLCHGRGLTDQLVQPLFGSRAIALIVNVESVSSAGR